MNSKDDGQSSNITSSSTTNAQKSVDQSSTETNTKKPRVDKKVLADQLVQLAKEAAQYGNTAESGSYYMAAAHLGNAEAKLMAATLIRIKQGEYVDVNHDPYRRSNFKIKRTAGIDFYNTPSYTSYYLDVINDEHNDLNLRNRALSKLLDSYLVDSYIACSSRYNGSTSTSTLAGFSDLYETTPAIMQALRQGVDLGYPKAAFLAAAFIRHDTNLLPEVRTLHQIDLCYRTAVMCFEQDQICLAKMAIEDLDLIKNDVCLAKFKLFLLYYFGSFAIEQDTKKALDYLLSGIFIREINPEMFNLLTEEIQKRLLVLSTSTDGVVSDKTKQLQEIQSLFAIATQYASTNDRRDARYKEITDQIQKISTPATSTATDSKIDDDDNARTMVGAAMSSSATPAPTTTANNGTTTFLNNVTHTLQEQIKSSTAEHTVLTKIEESGAGNRMTEQENDDANGKGEFNPYSNENL